MADKPKPFDIGAAVAALGALGGKSATKGSPSQKTAMALLLRDPRYKQYRNSTALGVIVQKAKIYAIDPVDLLAILGATGIPANAASIDAIGPKLRGKTPNTSYYGAGSPQAWAQVNGISLDFDPNTAIEAARKKGKYTQPYVPSPPGTPADRAGKAAADTAAKAAINDPWVIPVKGADGKIAGVKFATSVDPPKDVLIGSTSNGLVPIRRSDYLQKKSLINEYYQKYIGSKADDKQVSVILKTGMSEGAIINMLSKSPKFTRGQIWQAQAPSIKGYAKALMGEGYKVPPDFIRKAIINNWSEGTLRRKLIEKPEYLQGPEFRQNVSSLQNTYSSIQGRPDEAAMQGIKEAALGGWSSDQYAAYLRNQPQYTQSQEYKSKALSFLDALGLVTGKQTTTQGIAGLGQPKPVPGIEGNTPYSPRLSPTSPGAARAASPTPNKKIPTKPGQPGYRPV